MTGLLLGLFAAGCMGGFVLGLFVVLAFAGAAMAGTPQEEDVRAGIIRNE